MKRSMDSFRVRLNVLEFIYSNFVKTPIVSSDETAKQNAEEKTHTSRRRRCSGGGVGGCGGGWVWVCVCVCV